MSAPVRPPVVGLSAHVARAAWGVWNVDACLVPQAYVDAVARAGALPVVLPPLPGLVDRVLDGLDALVLTGGPDVDPARYGAAPGPSTQPPARARDLAETELLATAARLGLPVLGICRGLQVMNVARGGTLVQHLPDVLGTDVHCPAPGRYGRHGIDVTPGSLLAAALGDDPELTVPAYHHQAVDAVGEGLVVSGRAEDGVVEALEDPALPFWLGVQWHPEVGTDDSLFRALVAAAAHRASGAGAVPADRVRAAR